DLATTRPWNHPYASRNGLVIRSVATSNGRSATAPAFWTPCSGPPSASRNEIVTSASESTTRTPTTIRRRSAAPEREVSGEAAGRRTDWPSTANRGVRLRVDEATSLGAYPSGLGGGISVAAPVAAPRARRAMDR